jgi:hypothetical protein
LLKDKEGEPKIVNEWAKVDNSSDLGVITKQAAYGDASCGAHSISAVLNMINPSQRFDPLEVYKELQAAERLGLFRPEGGLNSDLNVIFNNLKERGIFNYHRDLYKHQNYKVESFSEANPISQHKIKALIDSKNFPILMLKNQARVQREDWIEPIQRPMKHASVAVGYGAEINPSTGRKENYVLIRDSYSQGNFPVKMSFEDFQKEVLQLGLLK